MAESSATAAQESSLRASRQAAFLEAVARQYRLGVTRGADIARNLGTNRTRVLRAMRALGLTS